MTLYAREILHITQQEFLRASPKPKSPPPKSPQFSSFEVQILTVASSVSDI